MKASSYYTVFFIFYLSNQVLSSVHNFDPKSHRNFHLLPPPDKCGMYTNDPKVTGDFYQPWLVRSMPLVNGSGRFNYGCDGVLISPTFVLTAATCLHIFNESLEYIVTGRYPCPAECISEVIAVEDTFTHEQYQGYGLLDDLEVNEHCKTDRTAKDGFQNNVQFRQLLTKLSQHLNKDSRLSGIFQVPKNVGLIKLKTPATFGPFVQPICLPVDIGTRSNFENEKVKKAGWFDTKLYSWNMKVAPNNQCKDLNNEVHFEKDEIICARSNKNQICMEKFLGPLIWDGTLSKTFGKRNYLVGIPSLNRPLNEDGDCSKNLVVNFPSVLYYMEWILDHLDKPKSPQNLSNQKTIFKSMELQTTKNKTPQTQATKGKGKVSQVIEPETFKPSTQTPSTTSKTPTQTPSTSSKTPTQTPSTTSKTPTQTPSTTSKTPTQTPSTTSKTPTQTPSTTSKTPTQTPSTTSKTSTQTPSTTTKTPICLV